MDESQGQRFQAQTNQPNASSSLTHNSMRGLEVWTKTGKDIWKVVEESKKMSLLHSCPIVSQIRTLSPLVIISQWCPTKYDHHFLALNISWVFSLSDTCNKFWNLRIMWQRNIPLWLFLKSCQTKSWDICIHSNMETKMLGPQPDLPTKAGNGLSMVASASKSLRSHLSMIYNPRLLLSHWNMGYNMLRSW